MTAAPGGVAVSELLFGEEFLVEAENGTHVCGRSVHDGYAGWVDARALTNRAGPPTHRVAARTALIFAEPDIKSRNTGTLPLGARIKAEVVDGAFLRLVGGKGGFIHARHAKLASDHAADPVDVALRLIGAPYLWGGRSSDGVDCSGLVQIALQMCGLDAPRDSGDQREALGVDVSPPDAQRGDLVFFPGHVGILVDTERLLHANAHWMATVIEPFADVVARLRRLHSDPVLAIKRLDCADIAAAPNRARVAKPAFRPR